MRSTIFFLLVATIVVASTSARLVGVETHTSDIQMDSVGACSPVACHNACVARFGHLLIASRCISGSCYCYHHLNKDIDQAEEDNDVFQAVMLD
jgi:hypothetical protein